MSEIETTSTVQALVNTLTKRIDDRIYRPGTKLPSERRLQEEFGVGRLALREALSRLNAMGIVNTAHGRGTFVQESVQSEALKNVLIPQFALNDAERLREFVEARAMLECEMSGLAARNRTNHDLAQLDGLLNTEVGMSDSPQVVVSRDLAFHQQIARIADNQFLALMHDALLSHIRQFLFAYVESKHDPVGVIEAHRPIYQAIHAGDERQARQAARAHIRYSMDDYQRFLQRQGNRI